MGVAQEKWCNSTEGLRKKGLAGGSTKYTNEKNENAANFHGELPSEVEWIRARRAQKVLWGGLSVGDGSLHRKKTDISVAPQLQF